MAARLTTTEVDPSVSTFSGWAGIGIRRRTRPEGRATASSAFWVSAVTSATGVPPRGAACELEAEHDEEQREQQQHPSHVCPTRTRPACVRRFYSPPTRL